MFEPFQSSALTPEEAPKAVKTDLVSRKEKGHVMDSEGGLESGVSSKGSGVATAKNGSIATHGKPVKVSDVQKKDRESRKRQSKFATKQKKGRTVLESPPDSHSEESSSIYSSIQPGDKCRVEKIRHIGLNVVVDAVDGNTAVVHPIRRVIIGHITGFKRIDSDDFLDARGVAYKEVAVQTDRYTPITLRDDDLIRTPNGDVFFVVDRNEREVLTWDNRNITLNAEGISDYVVLLNDNTCVDQAGNCVFPGDTINGPRGSGRVVKTWKNHIVVWFDEARIFLFVNGRDITVTSKTRLATSQMVLPEWVRAGVVVNSRRDSQWSAVINSVLGKGMLEVIPFDSQGHTMQIPYEEVMATAVKRGDFVLSLGGKRFFGRVMDIHGNIIRILAQGTCIERDEDIAHVYVFEESYSRR